MTSTRRRGPKTAMPIARPTALSGDRLRRSAVDADQARSGRRSRRHAGIARVPRHGTQRRPRRLAYHLRRPPPSRARPLRRVRPQARTGCRSPRSTRNSATSVVGSRPASCAPTISPPGSVTANSPSSDKASSAVTDERPGRQTKPLDRERCEWTETMPGATLATRPVNAADTGPEIGVNAAEFGHHGGLRMLLGPKTWEPLGTPPTTQVDRRTGLEACEPPTQYEIALRR